MSAYATALLESPHNDVVEEALRQADRANAAVARIADLEAQVAEMKGREEAHAIALGQHANEHRIALAQVARLREALEQKRRTW